MSMKVPTIVQEAQQALQDGYCVVIGLQSTGEVGLHVACLPRLGKRTEQSQLKKMSTEIIVSVEFRFLEYSIFFNLQITQTRSFFPPNP